MWSWKGSASVVVAVAFTITVWATFANTGTEAEANGGQCSNRTLLGSYGGSFDGQIPAGCA